MINSSKISNAMLHFQGEVVMVPARVSHAILIKDITRIFSIHAILRELKFLCCQNMYIHT